MVKTLSLSHTHTYLLLPKVSVDRSVVFLKIRFIAQIPLKHVQSVRATLEWVSRCPSKHRLKEEKSLMIQGAGREDLTQRVLGVFKTAQITSVRNAHI